MIYLISPDERKMLINAGDRMPLGTRYLSAALTENQIEHKVFDLNHDDETEVLRLVHKEKPEYIGLSFLSPTAKQTKDLIAKIKKLSLDTSIIVGGFHVTNNPDDFSGLADVISPGYGEDGLVGLLDFSVPNEFDINRYPIPNRQSSERYSLNLEGLRASTMITSRGCPFSCVFCSNFDKQQKRRNIDNIAEELDIIKSQGYQAVYLLDDTFTLNPLHVEDVTTELAKRGLKYRIETRATMLSEGTAKLLGETGCLVAGLGIESGSDEILKNSCKGQTTERVRQEVEHLNKYGVKTKGFFIIGLPGETEQTARQTINFAQELKGLGLAYADFYPLCPFPGTKVYSNPQSLGIEIKDRDYSHYLNGGRELICPTQTKQLSSERIKQLIIEARKQWTR